MKEYPYDASKQTTPTDSNHGSAERPSSSFFGEDQARKILERRASKMDPEHHEDLTDKLKEKVQDLKELEDGLFWIGTLIGRAKLLWSMIRDENFSVKNTTKFLIAAGLIYFIVPIDFTPDFIPGLGYIDDAIILSTLWSMVTAELERYMSYLKMSGRDRGDLDELAFSHSHGSANPESPDRT